MIAFVPVELGSGGVAACQQCAGDDVAAPRALADIASELTASASSWQSGPGPNVLFTGLEPFAYPSLPALVAAAVESGVERIRLRTDAGALATAGNAEGALATGVRQIEVVLHSADAEVHDRLTARPGLFAAAQAGVTAFLAAAAAADVPVAVTGFVPLCAHNASSAASAVAALASWGAVAVVLDASAAGADAEPAARQALETAVVNGIAGSVVGASWESDRLSTTLPWRVLEGAS